MFYKNVRKKIPKVGLLPMILTKLTQSSDFLKLFNSVHRIIKSNCRTTSKL